MSLLCCRLSSLFSPGLLSSVPSRRGPRKLFEYFLFRTHPPRLYGRKTSLRFTVILIAFRRYYQNAAPHSNTSAKASPLPAPSVAILIFIHSWALRIHSNCVCIELYIYMYVGILTIRFSLLAAGYMCVCIAGDRLVFFFFSPAYSSFFPCTYTISPSHPNFGKFASVARAPKTLRV